MSTLSPRLHHASSRAHQSHDHQCVQEERIASTLVGMATRDLVTANVEAVLQALDVLPNKRREEEEGILDEVLRILEPVKGLSWPSGRPENNE